MARTPLVLASLLSWLPLGCADNQESLIVLMAPAWDEDGACAVTDSNDALPVGLLDVSLPSAYMMPALLFNNTTLQNATKKNAGVQTNEMQLKSASVSLSVPQDTDAAAAVRKKGASLMDFEASLPTQSIAPQQTVGVLVQVIPQQTATALAQELFASAADMESRVTVVADVVFHASRSGNVKGRVGEIDAREFSFPITLCYGCLIDCHACEKAMCPAQTSTYVGGVCGNAQDVSLVPAACASDNG